MRNSKEPHYHIVVYVDNLMNEVGLVVVTSYKPEREDFFSKFNKGRNNKSYTILDKDDCSFLSHKSLVSGKLHPYSIGSLMNNKHIKYKGSVNQKVLGKVNNAVKNHINNNRHTINLLSDNNTAGIYADI